MIVRSTLTGRLVATVVGLVVLAAVVVSTVAAVAMSSFLSGRLDDQLRESQQRFALRREGPVRPPGHDLLDPCKIGAPQGPGDLLGQGPGTLVGFSSPGCRRATVISDRGRTVVLGVTATSAITEVPRDGEIHTVDLGDRGSYRVVATGNDIGTTYVGLPTAEIESTVARLVLIEVVVGLVVVGAGAAVGLVLVRSQMRPLRDLAATAHEVSQTPMAQPGHGVAVRVRDDLTDSRTEVGQVGEALDSLLQNVDSALRERDRTEQQLRQFVADASHELRTPLATIQGYAQLSNRQHDPETAMTALDKVQTESERMTRLVEDLLLLARLDAGRPLDAEPVDLTLLTLEAVNDARVVGTDHTWVLGLPDEPVQVLGDAAGLHQVLANLLTNARRHTPAGTTVTTTLEVTPTWARLSVSDDGPGLAPEMRDVVFDRFTRADASRARASGGAGLGLSIARSIVEAHHGSMGLGPAPGATFVVELPLLNSSQAQHRNV